jgi:hypothetical protein
VILSWKTATEIDIYSEDTLPTVRNSKKLKHEAVFSARTAQSGFAHALHSLVQLRNDRVDDEVELNQLI